MLAAADVAPLLTVGSGFLRDLPHGPLQQPPHHVTLESFQQGQQTLEERVLQGSQASNLLDAEAADHRLLTQ